MTQKPAKPGDIYYLHHLQKPSFEPLARRVVFLIQKYPRSKSLGVFYVLFIVGSAVFARPQPHAFITPEERLELENMGLGFFSSYSQHLPCHMMESKVLTKMVAIDYTYTENTLDAVQSSDIDVLECSVQPGENYGTDLNYADILRYSDIVTKSGKPCLIPTQRKIKPCEVRHLYEAGCKAVMIGAIVMGKEPDAKQLQAVTAAFREAIDAL